jgi:hypothetical protein
MGLRVRAFYQELAERQRRAQLGGRAQHGEGFAKTAVAPGVAPTRYSAFDARVRGRGASRATWASACDGPARRPRLRSPGTRALSKLGFAQHERLQLIRFAAEIDSSEFNGMALSA